MCDQLPLWAQYFDVLGPTVLAIATLVFIWKQGKNNELHLLNERHRSGCYELERQVKAVLKSGRDPTVVIVHHLIDDLPRRGAQQAVLIAALSLGHTWGESLKLTQDWLKRAEDIVKKAREP